MHMFSVNILLAVYFSHLWVFSHKNLGLCRELLMLLDYYKKKLELLVYIKVSKGNKVGCHNTSTDPLAQRHARQIPHITGF